MDLRSPANHPSSEEVPVHTVDIGQDGAYPSGCSAFAAPVLSTSDVEQSSHIPQGMVYGRGSDDAAAHSTIAPTGHLSIIVVPLGPDGRHTRDQPLLDSAEWKCVLFRSLFRPTTKKRTSYRR